VALPAWRRFVQSFVQPPSRTLSRLTVVPNEGTHAGWFLLAGSQSPWSRQDKIVRRPAKIRRISTGHNDPNCRSAASDARSRAVAEAVDPAGDSQIRDRSDRANGSVYVSSSNTRARIFETMETLSRGVM
jgi:hypothetical protein